MVSAIFFKFFQCLPAVIAVNWSLSELLLGLHGTSSQTGGD